MSFQELQQNYQNCTKCPKLVETRTKVVFGSGSSKAKILFIGEAPGFNEDKQGTPFCGMSGQVLGQLLSSANLSREDIFITNTILCHPPENRNPKKEEIDCCRERLDQLIAIIQPKVIVTIGNFATQRILNKTGITSLRGKVFIWRGIKVIPIIHPASYLYSGRNPEMFAGMKQDFEVIAKTVREDYPQKDLSQF